MNIGEIFLSLQGEGISTGIPSIFIRLTKCTLMCGGHNGELVKQGIATWWCDSQNQWLNPNKQVQWTNDELYDHICKLEKMENIGFGFTHLVWTGGEPLINENIHDIVNFLDYLYNLHPHIKNLCYNEVETNGTVNITDDQWKYFKQVNCSPKLSNSGMPKAARIKEDVIRKINSLENSWFKFVVSDEKDIEEIQNDFIKPFDILKSKIILMPSVDSQQDLPGKMKTIWDLGIKYNYRICSRLQILIFDKRPGV